MVSFEGYKNAAGVLGLLAAKTGILDELKNCVKQFWV